MNAFKKHLAHHPMHMVGCGVSAVGMAVGIVFHIALLAIVAAIVCGVMCITMIRMMLMPGHHHV